MAGVWRGRGHGGWGDHYGHLLRPGGQVITFIVIFIIFIIIFIIIIIFIVRFVTIQATDGSSSRALEVAEILVTAGGEGCQVSSLSLSCHESWMSLVM